LRLLASLAQRAQTLDERKATSQLLSPALQRLPTPRRPLPRAKGGTIFLIAAAASENPMALGGY
jgi:hypothetical protein